MIISDEPFCIFSGCFYLGCSSFSTHKVLMTVHCSFMSFSLSFSICSTIESKRNELHIDSADGKVKAAASWKFEHCIAFDYERKSLPENRCEIHCYSLYHYSMLFEFFSIKAFFHSFTLFPIQIFPHYGMSLGFSIHLI